MSRCLTGTPSACNNTDYQAKLLSTVKRYSDTHGFGELARRYAHNLANARFLWRNRIGAEQVEVHLQRIVQGQAAASWTFDGLELSLRDFDAPAAVEKDLKVLAGLIAQGLSGRSHVLLQVTAFARVGLAPAASFVAAAAGPAPPRPDDRGSDAQDVPRRELDELVVELGAAGAGGVDDDAGDTGAALLHQPREVRHRPVRPVGVEQLPIRSVEADDDHPAGRRPEQASMHANRHCGAADGQPKESDDPQ